MSTLGRNKQTVCDACPTVFKPQNGVNTKAYDCVECRRSHRDSPMKVCYDCYMGVRKCSVCLSAPPPAEDSSSDEEKLEKEVVTTVNPPMRRPSVAERIADVTEVRQSAVDQVKFRLDCCCVGLE